MKSSHDAGPASKCICMNFVGNTESKDSRSHEVNIEDGMHTMQQRRNLPHGTQPDFGRTSSHLSFKADGNFTKSSSLIHLH